MNNLVVYKLPNGIYVIAKRVPHDIFSPYQPLIWFENDEAFDEFIDACMVIRESKNNTLSNDVIDFINGL